MIEFREPPRTGFEFVFRIIGIRFRILPSFFLFSAILAAVFIWPIPGINDTQRVIGIVVDVACILAAVLFTEFIQGLVYRSYGIRSSVLIQEFGGGIYPEVEPSTAIQRMVVALSNPAACFMLHGLVYYSNQEWSWRNSSDLASFAYYILWLVSLFWGVIGLLPIFPYPGGRFMLEILTLLSPRRGLYLTLALSIALGVAYIAYAIAVRYGNFREIPLFEGVRLPASILLAVFMAMTLFRNWELLKMVGPATRRQPRPQYDDRGDYDDHDEYDRRAR